jgi:hypothetical protein
MNVNQDFKCINFDKIKCPMYFETDTYKICQLNPTRYINEKCIGFSYIRPEMEEIACKIAELTNEYDKLAKLKNFIIDNQENIEDND